MAHGRPGPGSALRLGRCARCGSLLPLTMTGALRAHLRDGRLVRVVGRRCSGAVPALGSVVPQSPARRPTVDA